MGLVATTGRFLLIVTQVLQRSRVGRVSGGDPLAERLAPAIPLDRIVGADQRGARLESPPKLARRGLVGFEPIAVSPSRCTALEIGAGRVESDSVEWLFGARPA